MDIPVREYEDHFTEHQVPHSTALHSALKGNGAYFAGPLARYNLNYDRLSPLAQEAARAAGMGPVCRNPFRGITVRAIEILYACEEALRLIDQYEAPPSPCVDLPVHAATGYGCTEAPRGILYHRYRLDDRGTVLDARIVPPTSQNQRTIEEDLRELIPPLLDLPDAQLRSKCEQAIRNYDPCISCATHFLRLEMDRG